MLLIITGLLSGLLGACTPEVEPQMPAAQAGPTFPLDVTDQMGRQVRIERMPERIISLSPSNTEISYALGLENELVGVTEFCDYPEAAKSKTVVGGFSTVDVEKVVASQPDLILTAAIHETEVIPQLEALDLTVLALAPKTLDEVLAAINLVGKCTGKREAAEELVTSLDKRIKDITDKTENLTQEERPRVFYLLWHDPLMTVGPATGIHELIVLAGGVSIAQGLTEEYPTIGLETVINEDPQVIVAGTGHGEGANLPYQFVLTEARLSETQARINDRVFEINTDLVGRPGPRMADGLEQLAQMVHPELFGAP
jgi:iron complex transport system substrate-binding protein